MRDNTCVHSSARGTDTLPETTSTWLNSCKTSAKTGEGTLPEKTDILPNVAFEDCMQSYRLYLEPVCSEGL